MQSEKIDATARALTALSTKSQMGGFYIEERQRFPSARSSTLDSSVARFGRREARQEGEKRREREIRNEIVTQRKERRKHAAEGACIR